MIKVEGLNTMRMRANHKINPAINQPTREFTLFVSNIRGVLNSPVDHARHEACARPSTGDRVAQAGSIGDEAMSRIFPEVPGFALGDGETFEDMIFTALDDDRTTDCPTCGETMQVSEESLGQLALSMLARM